MAEKKSKEKEPKNIVHQNAILVETIRKELREQAFFDTFSINPFVKRKFSFLKNILLSKSNQTKLIFDVV
jgi:hypothetical protein